MEGLEFADEIDVHWRAFQLDPTATAEPKSLPEAIDHKYGPGAFDNMTARLTALGTEAGIEYRFDIAQRVTSLPALFLVAWIESTYGPEMAEAMHDRLFRAYFTEGANIALEANLISWATEVGAEKDLVVEALASGAGREAVAADLEEAAQLQITGVPSFVIEGKHVIPGAQDTETMRLMLTRVHDKLTV